MKKVDVEKFVDQNVVIKGGGETWLMEVRVGAMSTEEFEVTTIWDLNPRVERIRYDSLDSIQLVSELEAGPAVDASGMAPASQCWALFTALVDVAKSRDDCQVTTVRRKDAVLLRNKFGDQGELFFWMLDPERSRAAVKWETSVSWIDLTAQTLDEAKRRVFDVPAADQPTEKSDDRLAPPRAENA